MASSKIKPENKWFIHRNKNKSDKLVCLKLISVLIAEKYHNNVTVLTFENSICVLVFCHYNCSEFSGSMEFTMLTVGCVCGFHKAERNSIKIWKEAQTLWKAKIAIQLHLHGDRFLFVNWAPYSQIDHGVKFESPKGHWFLLLNLRIWNKLWKKKKMKYNQMNWHTHTHTSSLLVWKFFYYFPFIHFSKHINIVCNNW